MRQQHYRFAHQHFMQEVLRDGTGWLGRLRSEGANCLIRPWTEAGQGVAPDDMADPMGLDAKPLEHGLDGMLVILPSPNATTECYFAAVVRAADGEVRYFLAERGADGTNGTARASWVEWRQGPGGGVMRIRGQELPSITVDAFEAAIAQELGVVATAGASFGGGAAGGGAFAGVADALAGGHGAPPQPASGGAFGAPPQPPSGGAFGAASAPANGGAFGGVPSAGSASAGAFGGSVQASSPSAFGGAVKPARKKGIAGKLVGCGCLSVIGLAVVLGGVALYLEEGVNLSEPGDEVKTVTIQPNVPFSFTYKWDGTNYASSDVWAVVDGTKEGSNFRLKGKMGCARFDEPELRDVTVALSGSSYRVANRKDRGTDFTAWLRVHDDYARASSTPFKCAGMLTADQGTIKKVRLVVTQRQRPSDWIAF